MERRENALVAPAALFLGATVAAVFAAVAYFVSLDDDEPLSLGNGGTPDDTDPQSTEVIDADAWNISASGTKTVNVQQGRSYKTEVVVSPEMAAESFAVNIVPAGLHYTVGDPEISNMPHVGAVIPITFTPQGNGSIELVWSEGDVPGQQILNLYRRLDFVIAGGGAAVA